MTSQIKWTFFAAVFLPLILAGAAQGQPTPPASRNPGKVVHVVVALCDNQYQGIVPVPARIGNGDDPANNLYWGAAYGVRTFFRKSKEWRFLSETKNPAPGVLERVIFRNDQRNVFLVADAYRGREIQRATLDFLKFAAGQSVQKVEARTAAERWTLQAGGGADLVAYVGHDGLMDFSLPEIPRRADARGRQAILLACASKNYFQGPLRQTGAHPLLWTTGLMAPEAYVLKAALDAWSRGEGGEAVRQRAAEAYHKYQKCGLSAARRLFATGW
ncbi:MAG TPA: hypothetical protein VF789_29710 [Thermoanaerobaculia bacterium]